MTMSTDRMIKRRTGAVVAWAVASVRGEHASGTLSRRLG